MAIPRLLNERLQKLLAHRYIYCNVYILVRSAWFLPIVFYSVFGRRRKVWFLQFVLDSETSSYERSNKRQRIRETHLHEEETTLFGGRTAPAGTKVTFQAHDKVFASGILQLATFACRYTQATRLFIVTAHHDLRTGHPGTSMIAADFLMAIHGTKRKKKIQRAECSFSTALFK